MTAAARLVGVAVVVALAVPGRAAGQVRWPSEGPPRPLGARPVAFPPYELRTLENGLRVVAVLHHEQPVVSIRMLVRAGGALDPPGKAGLASLAASLLTQGTAALSARQMNDEIDFIGGSMDAGAGTDLTFLNVVVMKDSFDRGLRMLSDMARRPAFAAEEVERQRQQMLSALRVNLEDPEFVADAVFDRLVYGAHPYGLPQGGTPETLASIRRDDLVAFHERNFVPNNAILAVVGDITADEAFEAAKKTFGDWPRRDVPAQTFMAPPDPTRRVVIVDKPDAVQTEVRVGHVGVKRNNSDYMSLDLAVRILGGEGANRLHQVLRTERSLTYGAKADMATLLDSGAFEASTNTRSSATGEVLRLIVDEFWRLQRERVGERELGDAKAYMTGSFPLTIETPDAIATQVLNVLFYGLPVQELQSFRDRVNAVRPEDVERVARYYLRPDRLSIVLVGNAAAFVPQLRGLGFATVEVVRMEELDLMAVNFKRPGVTARAGSLRGAAARGLARQPVAAYQSADGQAAASRVPQGDMSEGAVRALVARMIEAKGGLERLRSIRTLTVSTTATGLGPNAGQPALQSTTYLAYPNRVRVETSSARGDVIQVYDGTRAWVKDPRGTHDVPERVVGDLEAGLKRDIITMLLGTVDGTVRPRLLLDARDESGRLLHAVEFSGTTLDPVILYVDPGTGAIVKQTYLTSGGPRSMVEELFADFRPVDGLSVAFSATVRVRGDAVLERRIDRITINGEVGPALFRRPGS